MSEDELAKRVQELESENKKLKDKLKKKNTQLQLIRLKDDVRVLSNALENKSNPTKAG